MIVDRDVISSSKLKLVLSKYGECDIVHSGAEAVELFHNANKASNPYGLISLEMDLNEMTGVDVLEKIKDWESDNQVQTDLQVKAILILAEDDFDKLGPGIEQSSVTILAKPYDRKKLEGILTEIGLEKAPVEKSKTDQTGLSISNDNESKQAKAPHDQEIIIKKLHAYVNNVEQFKGAEIPKVLSELIKQGGEEAELVMSQYLSSDKTPLAARLELIRSAGYIQSPHFLVVLNKILTSEDNIKVVQEVIIAIARFNNQRALNILNQALQKFKNPMLLSTLRDEISRIKKNKPVLGLLPRFLQSYNNQKNFKVTVDILKKVVTIEECDMFLNYLKSGNPVLEDGAFEILCYAGNATIKTQLFNFFEDRIQQIIGLMEPECEELYSLISNLYYFLQKDFSMVEELLNEMRELFGNIKDPRIKQTIISILTKSQRSEALEFIKQIYNEDKDLDEFIIEQLSGNKHAVDFLFEKYHQGQVLKEKVIMSLLKSDQGLRYFIQHFFTFDLDKQELIIKNITFSREEYLMEFISKIYQSNLYGLKFQLLTILKNNFLFDFKDILFEDRHQREFTFMGNEYLETVAVLFPITSLHQFFHKIAFGELSNSKIIKYLGKILEIGNQEPVIFFNDANLINRLFNRIINASSMDLNIAFLTTLENIKFLDVISYKYLVDATNAFAEIRGGENINPKEKAAVTRIKARLREQLQDIRELDNLQKDLHSLFTTKPIEMEKLDKILESQHISVSLRIHHVAAYLADQFKNPNLTKDSTEIQKFYTKYPLITRFMRLISEKQIIPLEEDWSDNSQKMALLQYFQKDLRFIIAFGDKRKAAFIQDQLLLFFPEFQVLMDSHDLKDTDIFICDSPALKAYVEKNLVKTCRIFLYLENRMDFAQFRSLNPRALVKPFSGYRLLRMLLSELYINKQCPVS